MDANRRGPLIFLYDTTSADDLPPEKSNGQELWKKIREAIYFSDTERCPNHAAPFTISEFSVESRCVAVGVLKRFLSFLFLEILEVYSEWRDITWCMYLFHGVGVTRHRVESVSRIGYMFWCNYYLLRISRLFFLEILWRWKQEVSPSHGYLFSILSQVISAQRRDWYPAWCLF